MKINSQKQYARPGRKDRQRTRLSLLAEMYWDIEKLRVAQQVRQSHLKLDGSPFADDPIFELVFARLQAAQDAVDVNMKPLVQDHRCWTEFNLYVKGVGPHLLALVMGLMRDVTPLTNVSKLWWLAGLGLQDGHIVRPHKGEVLNYDPRLKAVLLGRVGKQLLMNKDPFARKLYDEARAREEAKLSQVQKEAHPIQASQNDEETQAKQAFSPHRRAIRKVIKLWLACLWDVWRRADGLPVTEPYAMRILGHSTEDMVTPEKWVDFNRNAHNDQNQ